MYIVVVCSLRFQPNLRKIIQSSRLKPHNQAWWAKKKKSNWSSNWCVCVVKGSSSQISKAAALKGQRDGTSRSIMPELWSSTSEPVRWLTKLSRHLIKSLDDLVCVSVPSSLPALTVVSNWWPWRCKIWLLGTQSCKTSIQLSWTDSTHFINTCWWCWWWSSRCICCICDHGDVVFMIVKFFALYSVVNRHWKK